MKKEMKIALPEEVVILLERLHYEYNTITDNIAFLIEQYKNDESFLDSPLFNKYQDRQVAKRIEYETAKQEMQDTYVPEEIRNGIFSWAVDFPRKTLHIYYEVN